jgi:hypothetical protein
VLAKKIPDAVFGGGTLAPDTLKTLVQAKASTSVHAVNGLLKRCTTLFLTQNGVGNQGG